MNNEWETRAKQYHMSTSTKFPPGDQKQLKSTIMTYMIYNNNHNVVVYTLYKIDIRSDIMNFEDYEVYDMK